MASPVSGDHTRDIGGKLSVAQKYDSPLHDSGYRETDKVRPFSGDSGDVDVISKSFRSWDIFLKRITALTSSPWADELEFVMWLKKIQLAGFECSLSS
jgi:hypothetical protein